MAAPESAPGAPRRRRRLPWILGGLGVVVVVAAVVGGLVFTPWLIFVNTEVNDEIPVVASRTTSGDVDLAGPVTISVGRFISHEHDTSGSAYIIEKPDGSRVLAIENLDTTTGPDVHVWLSAGEVIAGVAGWRTAAGAAHVDLGSIKGNRGNQVYDIPAGVDLAQHRAVVLWCVRFSVSFGAAQLHSA